MSSSKADVWVLNEPSTIVTIARLNRVQCTEGAGAAEHSPFSVIVLDPLTDAGVTVRPAPGAHGPLIACLVREGRENNAVETCPIEVFGQFPCELSGKQRIVQPEPAFAEFRDTSN